MFVEKTMGGYWLDVQCALYTPPPSAHNQKRGGTENHSTHGRPCILSQWPSHWIFGFTLSVGKKRKHSYKSTSSQHTLHEHNRKSLNTHVGGSPVHPFIVLHTKALMGKGVELLLLMYYCQHTSFLCSYGVETWEMLGEILLFFFGQEIY